MSMQSEERSGYGRYEGGSGYTQQAYEPVQQPQAAYDNNMVEAIAQRVAQLTSTGTGHDKIRHSQQHTIPIMGMRLALAIVSVVIMIPLTAIALLAVGGFGGYLIFGALCVFLIIINAIFNYS
ncbi:MAG: hypothetical protein J2P37_12530 [Ktedonobacteraceae bacterium]|nr:hypothetical protein [Ktedonobacteraceae bacterium]